MFFIVGNNLFSIRLTVKDNCEEMNIKQKKERKKKDDIDAHELAIKKEVPRTI